MRPGGRYDIAFTTPDGQAHRVGGEYREVVHNLKLVFTWAWQSTPERVSLVSITLQPVTRGSTELAFLHEQFFDTAARDNHQRGWSGAFATLDRFLGS